MSRNVGVMSSGDPDKSIIQVLSWSNERVPITSVLFPHRFCSDEPRKQEAVVLALVPGYTFLTQCPVVFPEG